jgi:hypothetical protein
VLAKPGHIEIGGMYFKGIWRRIYIRKWIHLSLPYYISRYYDNKITVRCRKFGDFKMVGYSKEEFRALY